MYQLTSITLLGGAVTDSLWMLLRVLVLFQGFWLGDLRHITISAITAQTPPPKLRKMISLACHAN